MPIAERHDFIEKICGADEDLKSAVEKLVADYDLAENFIESPVWTSSIWAGLKTFKQTGKTSANKPAAQNAFDFE